MVIDFTPSTKESEEARILKLKEDRFVATEFLILQILIYS